MKVGDLLKEANFPESGAGRWRALAPRALRGNVIEDGLVPDGMSIDPSRAGVGDARLSVRHGLGRPWIVTQRIDDPDPARANKQALDDIEHGATGLALVFEGAPNAFGYGLPAKPEALAIALHNVPLNRIYLRIDAHPASRASVDWLVALLGKRRVDPARLSVSFGIDPAAIFAGTGRLRMSIDALRASMPQSLAHFFALGLPGILLEGDGRVFHNAGGTEAQELGIAIASAVSHLRMFEEARQPLVYAAPHIGFSLAVDQDQLVSMAKLRALRLLWARVKDACSIASPSVSIHAETSYRMMTGRGPEANIPRSTLAALAAGTAGADSVTVLPYNIVHGLPDPPARRIARDMQSVLRQEGHIGLALDPAAGQSIDVLTEALCEAAWGEFQLIESEGGVLESLVAGNIQSRINEARARRAEEYLAGNRHLIGTTVFPATTERAVATLDAARRMPAEDGVVTCERLEPVRLDQAIESARQ